LETVYLETTFISYLVAIPARDLVVAAHQQITRDWWQPRRDDFHSVVSPVVIDEIPVGDKSEIKKRLDDVAALDVLAVSDDAESLAEAIMETGVLPPKAVRDAAHVAVASVHGVEYLLTWNCGHLANVQIAGRISMVCHEHGF
jgi:predicted nucleic acid-binding protein